MSSRKFAQLEIIEQRHRLDQLRPSLVVAPIDDSPAEIVQPDPFEETFAPVDSDFAQEAFVEETSTASSEASRSKLANEIDWDDDEWPDVDDWSLPEKRVRQQEVFDQDLEDDHEVEREEEGADEVPKLQPKKSPVSIDPLLGF
jgi:hypothetical protein